MRKIFGFFLFFLIFQIFFVKPASAANNLCTVLTINGEDARNKTVRIDSNTKKINIDMGGPQISPGTKLLPLLDGGSIAWGGGQTADAKGLIHMVLTPTTDNPLMHSVGIKTDGSLEVICDFPNVFEIYIVPVSTTCQINSWKDVYTPGDEVGIVVKKSSIPNYSDNEIYTQIFDPSGNIVDDASFCDWGTNNDGDFVHKKIIQIGKQGYWRAKVYKSDNSVNWCRKGGDLPLCQDVTFQVTSEPPLSSSPPPQGSFTWGAGQGTAKINEVCKESTISGRLNFTCNTAIGNIETDPTSFIKRIFGVLLGISGGIALILIITSGYSLMMAQGNPEKIQGAKETLTSAIVGLLFIIFSFVILEVIGVDLLKIPGLDK